MLWQMALPETYTKAPPEELARRITERRRELGDQLVILGHHYQTDEVIQHADFTGDSLKLSQLAASKVAERGAKYIIFCGVHFMAETADMLTPADVSVILPDLSAGCSMADMADLDDAVTAWNNIRVALADQGWHGRIIPITYINSTAAIKAFVGQNGGAVCTSSNAAKVFEWAMAGGTQPLTQGNGQAKGSKKAPAARDDIKIIFLPDQHLGRNTAARYGLDAATQTCLFDPRRLAAGDELGGSTPEQMLQSRVILWAGHCSVHKLFRPEHCDEIIKANEGKPPEEQTKVLVHPECAKEVVDKSDLAGSTEYIIKTIREAPTGSRWAVGTEVHLVNRIAREAAERGVSVRILSDCQCLCTTMYRIDQEHLCWVLDQLAKGRVVNRITVKPEVREQALLALDRMLTLVPSKPEPVATPVD